jgi:hypothetical protein
VVLLFSLFLPLWLLQFVAEFLGFAFFPHDHTILVGRIFINFTLSATSSSTLSPCLYLFSSFLLLLRVHIFSLLYPFHIFCARTFLPRFLVQVSDL